MNRTWMVTPSDDAFINEMAARFSVSPLVAQLLANRGLTEDAQVEAFLRAPLSSLSSPFALLNMDAAVQRILKAVRGKERIVVYGDYDVDGICATVVLRDMFRMLQVEVDFYIPSRFYEGYGMNREALVRLQAKGVDLIITVDNGISAHALLAEFKDIDFIITDHHRLPDTLPEAIIVNPQLEPEAQAFSDLSGCGVAFMLAKGVLSEWPEKMSADALLDLVAIATIADVVALEKDNRILVREGLRQLIHNKRPGLTALIQKVGRDMQRLAASDVAFQLAPRINACGRMDETDVAVALLEATDATDAANLAERVNDLNDQRKALELQAYQEAVAQLKEADMTNGCTIVVHNDEWHQGVIGIVASRLTERFNRPAVVFTKNHDDSALLKASARSVEGLDLFAHLQEISDVLVSFGGHEMAAGLAIERNSFKTFQDCFESTCRAVKHEWMRAPVIVIDAIIKPSHVSLEQVRELSVLEPFGCANPEPIFLIERAEVVSSFRIGKENDHLRMQVRQSQGRVIEGVYFRAPKDLVLQDKSRNDLVVRLNTNTFRGETKAEFHVLDIKPSWMGEDPALNQMLTGRPRLDGEIIGLCQPSVKSPVIQSEPSGYLPEMMPDHTGEAWAWIKEAKKVMQHGHSAVVVTSTADAAWRYFSFVVSTLPHALKDSVTWYTARNGSETLQNHMEALTKANGHLVFLTKAAYKGMLAESFNHTGFQLIQTGDDACSDNLDRIPFPAVTSKPMAVQARLKALHQLFRQREPSLIYVRSVKELVKWTRQFRSFLPRHERDGVAGLMPNLTCAQLTDLTGTFNKGQLPFLFITDESPWSQAFEATRNVVMVHPCFSETTFKCLADVVSQSVDPGHIELWYEDMDWQANEAQLLTCYPDRTWLGMFYQGLRRGSPEQTMMLPTDWRSLVPMFPERARAQIKAQQIRAGLQILEELSLIEVVKNNDNRYIKLTKIHDKRDLMSSGLFMEGAYARRGLKALQNRISSTT